MRERLAAVIRDHIGGDGSAPIDPHSWRCYDKERYPGDCKCGDLLLADILEAIDEG